jgi:uncharacterized protein (DUF4415 family)
MMWFGLFPREGQTDMNVSDLNNISQTDWAALEAMTDEEIDYSEIPPLAEAFFENATLRIPASQVRSLIQLDTEVAQWYQSQEADYKALIHSVLRRYMEDSRERQAG